MFSGSTSTLSSEVSPFSSDSPSKSSVTESMSTLIFSSKSSSSRLSSTVFSGLLSSSLSLLGFYIFYLMAKKRLILFSITSSLVLFFITLLPLLYFRFKTFGTGFPEIFLSPLPINIYGYDKFHNLLSGGSVSLLELFFPKNLNKFSTTYGPSLLFLFFHYLIF